MSGMINIDAMVKCPLEHAEAIWEARETIANELTAARALVILIMRNTYLCGCASRIHESVKSYCDTTGLTLEIAKEGELKPG